MIYILVLHKDLNILSDKRLEYYKQDLLSEFCQLSIRNFLHRSLYLCDDVNIYLKLKDIVTELNNVFKYEKERRIYNE